MTENKAKTKKTLKVLTALVGVFLLGGCCSVGGLVLLGSGTGTPTPTPPQLVITTAANATNIAVIEITEVPTPIPVVVPTSDPTSIPTPAYLTVDTIERERRSLTEIQRNQYDQNVLGELIEFQGQVLTVKEDGRVGIDEGGLWATVGLYGIPRDMALALNEGTLISGVGTIIECRQFLGLWLEIQVISWNN